MRFNREHQRLTSPLHDTSKQHTALEEGRWFVMVFSGKSLEKHSGEPCPSTVFIIAGKGGRNKGPHDSRYCS